MAKGICETCGCEAELTLHHLVPVSRAKNKYKDTKDDPSNHLMVCRQCHDAIHAAYDNTQLRDLYYTKALLLEAPAFKKFVQWRRKHQGFSGHSKMGNERKRR